MGQAFMDSEFFRRWNHHRTGYFTNLALIIIVPLIISCGFYIFSVMNPPFLSDLNLITIVTIILFSAVLVILAALYTIITNPPIE